MTADSYFEIGNTHEVCQDYALSGKLNDNLSYAIITDGCSQSHKECGEVDLGARVVAYAARDALFQFYSKETILVDKRGNGSQFVMMRVAIFAHVLRKIKEVRDSLQLHEIYSDSTLLVCISDGKLAYVFAFGDGGVIVKTKNDEIIYDEISYLSSAPYYVSYELYKERNIQYLKEFGSSPVIHTNYVIPFDKGIEDAKVTHRQAKEIDYQIYDFSSFIYSDFSSISVTSDGIKSFQALESDNKEIGAIEMALRFCDFKGKSNTFLKRRMLMIKKENAVKKITHYDDISAASIVT